jgi:N-6 DNA Methylase/TaqI-like C-terminal specificity domain
MPPQHDATLSLSARRQQGAYYTPAHVVHAILEKVLPPVLAPEFTLLDPACGDGAFLCGAVQRWLPTKSSRSRFIASLPNWIYGIDSDAQAVALARQRIAQAALGDEANEADIDTVADSLRNNIVVGNALLDSLPPSWPQQFSAVVGNPPYVNIRRLARNAEEVAQYRKRFRSADKAFDLYVLFLERAYELLSPQGCCGFLVPNKLASLEYAQKCRDLLSAETSLTWLLDYSRCRLFSAANVYPLAILFQKQSPPANHRVNIVRMETQQTTSDPTTIAQAEWRTQASWSWENDWQVEQRLPCLPLSSVCRLHSGTTGFLAQTMKQTLQEAATLRVPAFDFIVSGNIDRYEVALGNVRYMKQQFTRPKLPNAAPILTDNKRRLFEQPKIVISGMSKHLEAAWDAGGLALGVQVFAAAAFQVDPFFLLGLLNSNLFTHLFRVRFAAKRLGGGYFSINKGQLAQLPVPNLAELSTAHQREVRRISQLAQGCVQRAQNGNAWQDLAGEIEQLVGELFQLSSLETSQLVAESSLPSAA